MERRDFLKIALGAVGGAAALAATAQAAPLSPHQIVEDRRLSSTQDAHPAVTNENEVDRVSPEEVHWRHRHWRRWHSPPALAPLAPPALAPLVGLANVLA